MVSNVLKSVALVCLLLCASSLSAADFASLQRDVKKLSTEVSTAKRGESDAQSKLNKNLADQRKHAGDAAKLKALKAEAKTLANSLDNAREKRRASESKLADKQGELRAAAAKEVESKASGTIDKAAVTSMNTALKVWKGAVGSLPSPPENRSTSDIVDPAAKRAVREGDRKRHDAYIKWANAESARVKSEITKIDKALKQKAAIKSNDGAGVVSGLEALKKTLQSREKSVARNKSTSETRRKQLE